MRRHHGHRLRRRGTVGHRADARRAGGGPTPRRGAGARGPGRPVRGERALRPAIGGRAPGAVGPWRPAVGFARMPGCRRRTTRRTPRSACARCFPARSAPARSSNGSSTAVRGARGRSTARRGASGGDARESLLPSVRVGRPQRTSWRGDASSRARSRSSRALGRMSTIAGAVGSLPIRTCSRTARARWRGGRTESGRAQGRPSAEGRPSSGWRNAGCVRTPEMQTAAVTVTAPVRTSSARSGGRRTRG